jgi:hypothetical protein
MKDEETLKEVLKDYVALSAISKTPSLAGSN